MNMLKLINSKFRYTGRLALAVPFIVAAVPTVNAQDDLLELETFVTTGSLIPTAGDIPLAPVSVVSSAEIESSGVSSNVLEVIRKTTPQFVGSGNLGQSNANIGSGSTGGGSSLSLRNATTLVLINGRRAAFSPIASSGGSQFVDVNQIPVAAIDRIEILQDGASTTYGTDATSGVVNIILKSDYEGVEVGGRYGLSDNDGDWSERKVFLAMGTATENTKISITAEWYKSDPLFQFQRDFSAVSYGTPTFAGNITDDDFNDFYVLNRSLANPGVDLDLSLEEIVDAGTYIGPIFWADLAFGVGDAEQYAFNLAQYVTLLIENERKIMTLNVEHDISKDLSFFGDILFSRQETFSQINGQPLWRFFEADHPYNPLDVGIWAGNRFVANPRQYFYDTDSLRILGGLRGKITEDISFETAININRASQEYRNPGVIDSDLLDVAAGVVSGAEAGPGDRPVVNFFAFEQTPGIVEEAGVVGTATGNFDSTLDTFDFRVFGDLFSLPSGMVRFASGVEYRRETLEATADIKSQPPLQWTGATTLQPFEASREVLAAYAEFNVPVLGEELSVEFPHKLDLNLAVRHEQYNDTDDPTVFKVGFRAELLEDELVFRGTWGESFQAPTLYDLFGPINQGFTPSLTITPAGGGTPVLYGQPELQTGSNPNLEPTESESFTLGLVYTPKAVSGLSFELTYWNIVEENLVSAPPSEVIAQSVEDLGPASPYWDNFRIGGFDGDRVTAAGQVLTTSAQNAYITAASGNFAAQELDGLDLNVRYSTDFSEDSSLDISTVLTWFNSYKVQILPDEAAEETVGRGSVLNGTIPEWRLYTTATQRFKGFDATVGFSYMPSMPYENAPAGAEIDSYYTIDLAVGYSFTGDGSSVLDGLRVRVGVNNLTNEMPPLAPELYSEANADIATYDPIGRLFFIEAGYRF